MAKFVMLGKYSREAVRGISAGRTKKAVEIIKKSGGRVVSIYALLGEYDLVLIVELPGSAQAMKVSIALAKLSNISFTTFPAMAVEEFDRMMR
ncbi:MAG: GYD domain-containing protein [Candidatus Omnitrophica bacterium]|nr:GYD domain-containing protein [Candidatus Omnitrophota bacterium]